MHMRFVAILGLLLIIANGAIVSSFINEDGIPIDHHVGSELIKDAQKNIYRLSYDVMSLGAELIVNLDTIKAIKDVKCDLTSIELLIDFETEADAKSFYKVISMGSKVKFITSVKYNCSEIKPSNMVLMRKVIKSEIKSKEVTLHTAKGHYEEMIQTASVTLEKAEDSEHSKRICLGANSNDDCTVSKGPIQLLQNDYVKMTCSNCFVGAAATVFLDFKISFFKLRSISAGLKDIVVNSAFVLDLAAQGAWSTAVNKHWTVVDHAVIMSFWIGPIPFSLWFEIPLELSAYGNVKAKAAATAGATAEWKFGDAYVGWDEKNGWNVAKPSPKFTWSHVLNGDANFNGDSGLTIMPSLKVSAANIIQASINIEPSLMLEAKGDLEKKELCADLRYKVKSQAAAEMHINIPIIRLKHDKTYGPVTIVDTGVKDIGHYCVKTNEVEI